PHSLPTRRSSDLDAADLPIPNIRPSFQERHVFRTNRSLPKGTVSGVLKRPHHTRDVAQRRTLELAFAQCPRRFTFKIKKDKIAPGVEGLPKMKIAVNTYLVRV